MSLKLQGWFDTSCQWVLRVRGNYIVKTHLIVYETIQVKFYIFTFGLGFFKSNSDLGLNYSGFNPSENIITVKRAFITLVKALMYPQVTGSSGSKTYQCVFEC